MIGRDLIHDINAFHPAAGECGLWWLGQQGFVVKLGGAVLYIDAFLTDLPGRRVPPLLEPSLVTNADVILGSHDHADHIDRPAWPLMADASPGAIFVVPELVRKQIVDELRLPAERVLGVDEGRPASLAGVTIEAVPAAHEFLDTDPLTGLHPYLGFIIEGYGMRLYHAGDTCLWEGLHEQLRRRGMLDAMILPINGRDARRLRANCIGNMTYQEAADLAGALHPGTIIPAHYEMFAMNSSDVDQFIDYVRIKYPDRKVVAPRHGERLVLGARHSNNKGG